MDLLLTTYKTSPLLVESKSWQEHKTIQQKKVSDRENIKYQELLKKIYTLRIHYDYSIFDGII